MANETLIANLTDSRASEIIMGDYERFLAERTSLPQHPALRYAGRVNGEGILTKTLPFIGIDANDMTEDLTEIEEMGFTQLPDDKVTVTVARKGKAYAPSDMARMTDNLNVLTPERFVQDAFATAMQELVKLAASTAAGFTGSVGTSGQVLGAEAFLEAQKDLDVANADGETLALLAPQQWFNLRAELALDSGGTVQWQPATAELVARRGTGYKGKLFGSDIFVTNRVTKINADADFAGALVAAGGLVWADGVPPIDDPTRQVQIPHGTFELDRSGRKALSEYILNLYLGMSIGQDARGVKLVSGVSAS